MYVVQTIYTYGIWGGGDGVLLVFFFGWGGDQLIS